MDRFRIFSRHLVEQNVPNLIFGCYFINIAFVIFSILSQIQIAIFPRKMIPGLPRLEPHRKVNATTLYKFSQTFKTLRKTANLFSNLDFLPKPEFPKTLDLSMDFPWIFHGFPTPWIFGEAAGAADKKPDQREGPTSAQARPIGPCGPFRH